MQNILMKYCRIREGLSPSRTAKLLGIHSSTYRALECGEILMTPEQTKSLAKILHLKPQYLYDAALQLDSLLTKVVVIRVLKARIDKMKEVIPVQEAD
jgi:transcriptional regulator with XRE-family HTH domain